MQKNCKFKPNLGNLVTELGPASKKILKRDGDVGQCKVPGFNPQYQKKKDSFLTSFFAEDGE